MDGIATNDAGICACAFLVLAAETSQPMRNLTQRARKSVWQSVWARTRAGRAALTAETFQILDLVY
jgi:hypothetical protein